ncbi:hypothetical protein LTR05_003386 [Lithohypha guttulata]|uniref:Major facilitator superfamily (MFS) profile domain-containing protein n=1 Tax=Lithohypha guttulata TaxID=1690604 RepID=A0AAN7T5I4_9EURO|nr:hypothetical protein LTR05_003386 [Lithohypha guttulata]
MQWWVRILITIRVSHRISKVANMGLSIGEGRLRQFMSKIIHSSNYGEKLTSRITTSHACQTANDTTSKESGISTSQASQVVSEPQAIATKASMRSDTTRHNDDVFLPSASRRPTDIELDALQWGHKVNGPESTSAVTPGDLESSPVSGLSSPARVNPQQHIAVTPSSPKYPYMNRWRILATCIAFFVQGMNDSATGALLPYMERYYHISHAIMSLIFVANACGFIAAGPVCHILNNRFGRARVLSSCTILNTLAYTAIVCQPPFPVVIVAFFFLGFGFAIILALDNVFLVNLQGGTTLLGYMHGTYGVGGIVAPFVATAMVSQGIRWSLFYAILLALSLISTVAFFWTFRNYESETTSAQLLTALERTASRQTDSEEKKNILKKALRNRTTLLGALLIFSYQAAEVAISGWVISFLIDYRNGDPTQVGYVTSGFWGGITLGRFLLVMPCHKIGDRISIVILIAGTAAFQFMVWFLPNVIGNAVAVAIIGLLLGPIYPCATGVFSKLLPSYMQITSLGLIGSVGSSGGAVGPLLTGALAQKLGTVVLNPICIVLCVVMECAWLGLPRVVKRSE